MCIHIVTVWVCIQGPKTYILQELGPQTISMRIKQISLKMLVCVYNLFGASYQFLDDPTSKSAKLVYKHTITYVSHRHMPMHLHMVQRGVCK
jgi:hypothetical protein